MKNNIKKIIALIFALVMIFAISLPVFAEDAQEASQAAEADSGIGMKAIAASICIGLAATAGAISMGMAISKTNDGISRQPEAQGALRTSLMLGLVFIETAIIYALIVAILIIFVL